MIFLGYGVFKCSLPGQGSRANSCVFAVDLLTHLRNQQYPVCLAFSCDSYCSSPTSTYFPHCCQSELLDHEPDWSPIVQRREFIPLSLARQEPSLLELLLQFALVFAACLQYFRPLLSTSMQCLFSLFSFSVYIWQTPVYCSQILWVRLIPPLDSCPCSVVLGPGQYISLFTCLSFSIARD